MEDLIANLEKNLLANDPENWSARAQIIRSCLDSGLDADANRLVSSAPAIPDEEDALLLAAKAWQRLAPEKSLAQVERVLGLNPRSVEAFSLRVDLLEAMEASINEAPGSVSEVAPSGQVPAVEQADHGLVATAEMVGSITSELPHRHEAPPQVGQPENQFHPQPGEFPTRSAAEAVATVRVSPLVPPDTIPELPDLSYQEPVDQVPVHYTPDEELMQTRRNVYVVPEPEEAVVVYDYQEPNQGLFVQETGLEDIHVAAEYTDDGMLVAPPSVNSPASQEENDRKKAALQRKDKLTSIALTIAAHVLIFFLIGLVVIAMPRVLPPQITATAGPVSNEQTIEKKQIFQPTTKPPAPAASATPELLTSAFSAPVSVPTVDFTTPDAPVNLGTSFGAAVGFGTSTTMGAQAGAMTMFGRAGGGGGLAGTFYDMKQTPKEEPNSNFNLTRYIPLMEEFADAKFSRTAVSDFFKADRKISFSALLIPQLDAAEGPKAFEVEDKVDPKFWFVHYTGRVKAPKPGKWRFAGGFDNILYVYVDNELVFDGSFRHPTAAPRPDSEVTQSFAKPGFCIGTPVLYGKWVDLNGPFKLDIVIGESAGGLMGGGVLIQHEDSRYDEDPDGTPILPLLAIGEAVSSEIRKRLEVYPGTKDEPSFLPYPIAKKSPIFEVIK